LIQSLNGVSMRPPPLTQNQRVPSYSGLPGSRNTAGTTKSASLPVIGFQ